MEVPFDVLDSIFSCLKSHPDSLVACSKAHPVFSQAIERHLYYHIRLCICSYHHCQTRRRTDITGYTLEPSYLIELLTESPRIVNYIRILQIDFKNIYLNQKTTRTLRKITSVLPMFSRLECIILMAPSHNISWEKLPQSFKEAMENCLRLSTLQRLHVGELCFPLSILDKHVNINCFSLSGHPQIPDCLDDTNFQLTALSLGCTDYDSHLITWAKRHIDNLQSLKCDYSDDEMILELLEVCSHTLGTLDLYLEHYQVIYDGFTQEMEDGPTPSINLSSLPRLQHLIIRGSVYHVETFGYYHVSHLPAIVEIFKTAPLLQRLTIDINVSLEAKFLSAVNFPFFAALAESLASFRHIELYLRGLTTKMIVPLLGEYATALIEQGVLVIHVDETAPGDSRFFGPE